MQQQTIWDSGSLGLCKNIVDHTYRDTPGHLAYAEILEHLTGPHDGCSHGCIIVSIGLIISALLFHSGSRPAHPAREQHVCGRIFKVKLAYFYLTFVYKQLGLKILVDIDVILSISHTGI